MTVNNFSGTIFNGTSMVFVANDLKKPVVVLVMDVPSKIVQLKFLIVILQATSNLIHFYLENVKVKQ